MIKKKLNILLLLSLALLFTSLLGTTSFAKTLTQEEIRNFVCNGYVFFNDSEPTTEFINSLNEVDFSSWVSASETYEGQWYISFGNSYLIDFGYYYGNANNMNLYVPYIYNNNIGVNSSYLTRKRSRLDTRSFGTVTTFGNNNVGLNTGNYFFYTDTNIYNTSEKANASILYNAGYMTRENIFNYNFTPPVVNYFEFIVNSDVFTGTAKIYGDTSNTEYYLLPYNSNSVRLGALYDIDNLESVVKRKYRYNQANRDFALINEYQSNINDTNFFLYDEDYLQVYEYYQPDTTEFIIFTAKDSSFNQIVIPIYFTTRNTSVAGGYINLDNTFSGDYYNNYNNDTNTDKIIDNTNNNNEVPTIVGDFFGSGDSGETLLNNLGFNFLNRFDNPFIATVRTVFLGILNCFLDDNQVTLDLGHHGYHMYISSADFTTDGNSPIFILLKYALEGLWIFFFCKAGYSFFEHAITADIPALLDDTNVDGTWHSAHENTDWRIM